MTLPPVVSDAEVCPNTDEAWDPHPPHCWEKRWSNNALGASVGRGWKEYEVCRYCGGRKPTDAAPSREGVGG